MSRVRTRPRLLLFVSVGSAAQRCEPLGRIIRKSLFVRDAFAALTHDPKIDDPGIEAALSARCFYVGALGSRKTHGRRLERLKESGLGEDALAAIHAPIGLEIGARTPAEIAVATLAEIIRSKAARRAHLAEATA